MIKPYMKVITEDLYPYLVSIETVPNSPRELKYTFKITNMSKQAYKQLLGLTHRLKCWRHVKTFTFTWNTDSIVLRDMYNNKNSVIRRSAQLKDVEDIPSDMLDYTINDTKSCCKGTTAPIMKGKEMSNKFKVNYKINIKVNGKAISIKDPINSDDALEVVLELNERLNALNAQLKNVEAINDDSISVNKVTEVVTNEIDEIKEFINYVNDNIEEE